MNPEDLASDAAAALVLFAACSVAWGIVALAAYDEVRAAIRHMRRRRSTLFRWRRGR